MTWSCISLQCHLIYSAGMLRCLWIAYIFSKLWKYSVLFSHLYKDAFTLMMAEREANIYLIYILKSFEVGFSFFQRYWDLFLFGARRGSMRRNVWGQSANGGKVEISKWKKMNMANILKQLKVLCLQTSSFLSTGCFIRTVLKFALMTLSLPPLMDQKIHSKVDWVHCILKHCLDKYLTIFYMFF